MQWPAMATLVQCSSQLQTNMGHVLSAFNVLSHHMDHKKKTVMSNYLRARPRTAVTWTSRNQKMAWVDLAKMTFLTFVCSSCSTSPMQLFFHPIAHLCAKFGALDSWNYLNRCLEILDAAGPEQETSLHACQGLCSLCGLFFLQSNAF